MQAATRAHGLRTGVAAGLAVLSMALALSAVAALSVGWFWARQRGDWQAWLLWSYWCGTPLSSGVSLWFARRQRVLRWVNLALLALWAAVSLLVLVVPLLARSAPQS